MATSSNSSQQPLAMPLTVAQVKPAGFRKLRRYEAAWLRLKRDKRITLEVVTGYEQRVIKAICKEKDADVLKQGGWIIHRQVQEHKSKEGISCIQLTLKKRVLIQDL